MCAVVHEATHLPFTEVRLGEGDRDRDFLAGLTHHHEAVLGIGHGIVACHGVIRHVHAAFHTHGSIHRCNHQTLGVTEEVLMKSTWEAFIIGDLTTHHPLVRNSTFVRDPERDRVAYLRCDSARGDLELAEIDVDVSTRIGSCSASTTCSRHKGEGHYEKPEPSHSSCLLHIVTLYSYVLLVGQLIRYNAG